LDVVQRARRTRTSVPDERPAPGEVVELMPVEPEEFLPALPPQASIAPIPEEAPRREPENRDTTDTPLEEVALYRIPLAQIAVGGINTRVIDEESADFLELVENIRQYGQLEAVWVGQEDDHWRLIAGERRYRALTQLGAQTVLAKIVDAPRQEWPVLMLVENLQRKEMTAWEEAHGYQGLLDNGLSLDEISRRVGRTKGHVSTVLKIARNPLIMAALEDGRISSLSLAREMSVLLDRTGQEMEDGMIARVLEHVARRSPTIIELRKWIQVQLSLPTSDGATPSRRKRPISRGTFLRSEEQRLLALTQKLPMLSNKERDMLAQMYEEQAQRVRRMAQHDA